MQTWLYWRRRCAKKDGTDRQKDERTLGHCFTVSSMHVVIVMNKVLVTGGGRLEYICRDVDLCMQESIRLKWPTSTSHWLEVRSLPRRGTWTKSTCPTSFKAASDSSPASTVSACLCTIISYLFNFSFLLKAERFQKLIFMACMHPVKLLEMFSLSAIICMCGRSQRAGCGRRYVGDQHLWSIGSEHLE